MKIPKHDRGCTSGWDALIEPGGIRHICWQCGSNVFRTDEEIAEADARAARDIEAMAAGFRSLADALSRAAATMRDFSVMMEIECEADPEFRRALLYG